MIRARGAVSVDYLNPLLLDGKVLRQGFQNCTTASEPCPNVSPEEIHV